MERETQKSRQRLKDTDAEIKDMHRKSDRERDTQK